ncbi:hypothetical protein [Streptomyces sp. NPDC092370]|uniref:hypothetical protein n=1 Tax=Streptomyces sp. NPDC092370 TaxID=3366016 RepID=UPI0037FF8743
MAVAQGLLATRGPAREALELLVHGYALPTNGGQALAALRELDAALVVELAALLDGGRQIDASVCSGSGPVSIRPVALTWSWNGRTPGPW